MTKHPKPHRTTPLDRDGEGHDDGSLPGNETAPMFDETKRDDTARDVSAADATRQAAGWTRDDARLVVKLEAIGADVPGGITITKADAVSVWTDLEAFDVEAFADAMLRAGRFTSNDGEEFNADGSPIVLPPALNEWEIEFTPATNATFTAEEIAAGETVAMRIRELEILVNARRLYRSAEGYSENYGAPYIADATVQAWVAAGLAEDIPSAGSTGGVKLTHEARRQLYDLQRGAPG